MCAYFEEKKFQDRMHTKEVGLLIVFVTVLLESCLADKMLCSQGGISPEVPYFLESQDIVLECHSKDQAKNLSFLIGSKGSTAVERFIEFRNSTYVKLNIPNITKDMVEEYGPAKFVACVDTKLCLANVYVKLDYYPKEVSNIDCIMEDFQQLQCHWDLGVTYKYPHHMNVTSRFKFLDSTLYGFDLSDAPNWEPCPDNNWTSCYWNETELSERGLGFPLKVVVYVAVTNLEQNITIASHKVFLRDDIVKPFPVRLLTYNSTEQPTCVQLSWEQNSQARKFRYNITYHSKCESSETTLQIECSTISCSYRLCGLNPFTLYNVSVASRYCPDRVERGYWSRPAYTTVITGDTVPKKSPVVTEGLYQFHQDSLTLYWKPLNECEIHAWNTFYEVSVNGVTNLRLDYESFSINFKVKKIASSGQSDDKYTGRIEVGNDVGKASGSTLLEINLQKDVPWDSELVVEYKGEDGEAPQYLATIKMDDRNNEHYYNITHTVAWCKRDSKGCKEPFDWLETFEVTDVIQIPVVSPGNRDEYQFSLITKGYSRMTNRMVSTDMATVECIYDYNTAPLKPVPNIKLAPPSPFSMTVDWSGYECQLFVKVGYVENYVVTYCEAVQPLDNTCLCLDKKKTEVTVSRSQRSYTVSELAEGTGYCIWVAANNSAGTGPENNEVLFHLVTSDNVNNVPVVLAVSGCVLLLSVLLIVLFVKCFERIKARFREYRNILVPQPHVEMMDYGSPTVESPERLHILVDHQCPQNEVTDDYFSEFSDTEDTIMVDNSRTPLLGYQDITGNIDTESDDIFMDELSLNSQSANDDADTASIEDFDQMDNDHVFDFDENKVSAPISEGSEPLENASIDEKPNHVIEDLEKMSQEGGYDSCSFNNRDIKLACKHEIASRANEQTEGDFVIIDMKDNEDKECNIDTCFREQSNSRDESKELGSEYDLWNTGTINGYMAIPVTNIDYGSDSDFGDDIEHTKESIETNLSCANRISVENIENTNTTEELENHDSAVYLNDEFTKSCEKIEMTEDNSKHDLGERTRIKESSVDSETTSDYGGSDHLEMESDDVNHGTKKKRSVISGVVEHMDGYSQAHYL